MKNKLVKDIDLRKGMNANELVKELYESGGFTAKKLATGVDIIENMINEKDCVKSEYSIDLKKRDRSLIILLLNLISEKV